jgi:hypothetical protein
MGLTFRSWWTIFFLLNILITAGMIVSIIIPRWVFGENDGKKYFEGGLLQSHEFDLKLVDEEDSYEDLSDYFCDIYDTLKDNPESTSSSAYESLCKLSKNLYKAGRMFIGLAATAAGATVFWVIFMAVYCSKGKGIALTYLCSCISLISQILAVVIYVVLTHLKFSSCDDFPNNGDDPELCADYGPIIALSVLATLALVNILFFVVACKVQKLGHLSLSKNESDAFPQNTSAVMPSQVKTKENVEVKQNNQFIKTHETSRVFRPSNRSQENNSYQFSNQFTRRINK